jgi:hypothetical protein
MIYRLILSDFCLGERRSLSKPALIAILQECFAIFTLSCTLLLQLCCGLIVVGGARSAGEEGAECIT